MMISQGQNAFLKLKIHHNMLKSVKFLHLLLLYLSDYISKFIIYKKKEKDYSINNFANFRYFKFFRWCNYLFY